MKIRLTLLKIENEKIGEMACGFAMRMNGVDSAELDGETLTLTLSPSGSENVVKSAVTSYIKSLDGNAAITEGDVPPQRKPPHSRKGLRLAQIAVSALLTAAGVFAANEATALFTFIAAYIMIGWDVFASALSGFKGKNGVQLAGIAAAAVSLALFLFGLYPAGAAIMILYKILILIFTNKKKKERRRNTDNS